MRGSKVAALPWFGLSLGSSASKLAAGGRGKTAAFQHGRGASSSLPACCAISKTSKPLQASLLSRGLGWAEPGSPVGIEDVMRLQSTQGSGLQVIKQAWRGSAPLDSSVHQRHYNASSCRGLRQHGQVHVESAKSPRRAAGRRCSPGSRNQRRRCWPPRPTNAVRTCGALSSAHTPNGPALTCSRPCFARAGCRARAGGSKLGPALADGWQVERRWRGRWGALPSSLACHALIACHVQLIGCCQCRRPARAGSRRREARGRSVGQGTRPRAGQQGRSSASEV